jgi:hypothetical protein
MTRNVVRAHDLGPLRAITEETFAAICDAFDIQAKYQAEARNFLTNATEGFRAAMAREQALPTRQDDGLAIERILKDLRRAEYRLNRLNERRGLAASRCLRIAGRQLAPALSVSWMLSHFPHDFDAPDDFLEPPDARYSRPPMRGRDWEDPDSLTLGYRVEFMGRNGGAAFKALFGDQIAALENGRRSIVLLPDGRKPLKYRLYMLAALAELWRRLGHRPTSGPNSKFGAFCEAVFEPMGWPTGGVNSALRDAIKLWRRLYR